MPRNYVSQQKIDQDFGWLNNQQQNAALYADLASRESMEDVAHVAKIILTPGYRLVRVDESEGDEQHFSIALLCDTASEVVYLVKCNIWTDVVLKGRPLTQVLVWRTGLVKHRRVTSGFAEDIFRNYLLDHYSIIASDSCQTREGRDFWVRQMGYALEFGECVYRYDLMAGQLQSITDPAVIVSNSCDLWGDDVRYEHILAVITKIPLT
ncbi:MAG: hypothetical protein IBX50_08515 [Marinospirillum sp.]|uniref:hypothetical protein n=1 Tax=Marinospirillum sp. TaxID=2183934 RepID=UPI0019D9EBAA|nr:hypothetical protein [Marinospirillum sp.]MBE0506749.1 hypothetical protein [Marinospirillum sp.]